MGDRAPRRGGVGEEGTMSMAVGQAIAFMKVGSLALAVMAGVWAVVKVVEARGRRKNDGGNGE